MLVSIRELARDETGEVACFPIVGGEEPLPSEIRATLRIFQGLAIEVDSARAFPLQIYMMGGKGQRLGIHPRNGFIEIGAPHVFVLNDANGHELIIFRSPLKE
jgi:hypothetical protein